MKRFLHLAFSILAALATAAAGVVCGGRVDPVELTGDDGATPHADAGDAAAVDDARAKPHDPPGACRLVGTECVGAPVCCPYRGVRIDVDAGCHERGSVVIGCSPVGLEAMEPCSGNTGINCYVRESDAGREVFWTGSDYGDDGIPGGRVCDGTVWPRVDQAMKIVCR